MRADAAEEIILTQPEARRAYAYARDSYAPRLLGYVLDRDLPIARLRASRFGRLLARPNMAQLAGFMGNGRIGFEALLLADGLAVDHPDLAQDYAINLETWDGDYPDWYGWQVSRRGVNLVVRLDFTSRHDAAYHKYLRPGEASPFAYFSHPGNCGGYNTLAWARIDLDLNDGEALIEEVQTDWLRLANALHAQAKAGRNVVLDGRKIPVARIERYMFQALWAHKAIWQEAAMAAALRVIVEDVGIRSIFMHTPESGVRLKNIEDDAPPRSIYTDLPKKFCFAKGDALPRFLEEGEARRLAAMRRNAVLPMWHLDLTPGAF